MVSEGSAVGQGESMSMKVGIIDYGMGNIGSVQTALRGLRADCIISGRPEDL